METTKNKMEIKWIPLNWYKIIFSDDESLTFQFITITFKGEHCIKLCDGTTVNKLLNSPFIEIIDFGSICPCFK
jgi:hypothetical protein